MLRCNVCLTLPAGGALAPALLPPADTVRTFYAYHVMMDGSSNPSTLSLGPHNQVRCSRGIPPVPRLHCS